MATSEQIKALLRSHFENDKDRFSSIALQMAAHEARLGHTALARDIKNLVDKSKKTKVTQFPKSKEMGDFFVAFNPDEKLADMVASPILKERIVRILKEYRAKETIQKHGLAHRRKILLSGPPGTGKTMTAKIIANDLGLPLYVIQMDKLMTKYMGETSAKLRLVFEFIQSDHGVFLFDEFDAIGADRGMDNDVGEMRRVLNSFLQFIENDTSDNLVIAATNNINLLDSALFRRFDDVVDYSLPSVDEICKLINNNVGSFGRDFSSDRIANEANGLSHAEIVKACHDSAKEAILLGIDIISEESILNAISERQGAYKNKKG